MLFSVGGGGKGASGLTIHDLDDINPALPIFRNIPIIPIVWALRYCRNCIISRSAVAEASGLKGVGAEIRTTAPAAP